MGVNVKTVFARLLWQALLSREKSRRFLREYIDQYGPIKTVQFDDLLTFEHTKCKPLSIPVAVIDRVRLPIGFRVASIPAFGHLAATSRKRYGRREHQSRRERQALFAELKIVLSPDVHFKTDGHEHYATLIKQYFPSAFTLCTKAPVVR